MAIEKDDAARRLARAILTDLVRYNRPKLSAAADPRTALAAEIAEGRALFCERVAPTLHSIFEHELSAWDFSGAAKPGPTGSKAVLFAIALAIAVVATGLLLASR